LPAKFGERRDMNDRVVEILVFLMSKIRSRKSNLHKLELLSENLLTRGYSQNEISSAFSWLFERIEDDLEEIVKFNGAGNNQSFRILHDMESLLISPEAYGYLIQLRELRLIDDADIEQVIERVMMVGTSRVNTEEIKIIVASLLSQDDGGFKGQFTSDGAPVIH